MQSPITLYVWEEGGVVSVGDEAMLKQFGVDAEALIAASAGRLKRYEVWLKEPLTYAMQLGVERACLNDPAQRLPAMVEAYVERWTLPGNPTAQGFLALHPNIADRLGLYLNARVFPLLGGQPDFFEMAMKAQIGKKEEGPKQSCVAA
jgi:hypothetical protein